jgi:methylated-DNA-protein-cysteine methyltransferase-like protein
MTEGTQRIITEILAIPRGRVSSYGDIARRAGFQNGARQVVRALHSQSEKYNLPWYRVIRADGFIALEGEGRALQIKLLKREGVKVSSAGKVDLAKYGAKYHTR